EGEAQGTAATGQVAPAMVVTVHITVAVLEGGSAADDLHRAIAGIGDDAQRDVAQRVALMPHHDGDLGTDGERPDRGLTNGHILDRDICATVHAVYDVHRRATARAGHL